MVSRRDLENRAARMAAAALLSSDLSIQELRAVAKMFNGGRIGETIYLLIEDFCYNLDQKSWKGSEEVQKSASDANLLNAIRQKKLSKISFLRRAEKLGVIISLPESLGSTSMERLVEQFISIATPRQYSDMMNSFNNGNDDAFLKGIMRRVG